MEPLRPLTFLESPLETCLELGRRKLLFHRLMGNTVSQALMHLPSNVHIWRPIAQITEARPGEGIIIEAHILDHEPNTRYGKPFKVHCSDGQSAFNIIYFNAKRAYLEKLFPLRAKRYVMGKAEKYLGQWSIIHPESVTSSQLYTTLHYQPIYPLTTGVTNKCVQRVLQTLLQKIPSIPEWLSPQVLQEYHWPSWRQAVQQIHAPRTPSDLLLENKARQRMAYDELFSHQLALHLSRYHSDHKQQGNVLQGTGILTTKLTSLLPFSLTASQQSALQEIFQDMAAPFPMARLLQGDVGSGKTLVALMAMLRAAESGYQAALLAPTDILARQHADSILPLCQQLGITVRLLTGRDKGKAKQQILNDLASHQIQFLIGTHAIIQDKVNFANLGLAVIDEQHRFGVEQRLSLAQKGKNPDILAMTATPIPRTMVLAHYGDMEVSVLAEKPAGRLPIQTKVVSLTRFQEVMDGIERALFNKAKIFWVCPLVEESEVLDLSAAQDRFQQLQNSFNGKVGLVHGKMKALEKDAVMDQFTKGTVDILVATTVIEVGMNVPDATIMIIEHAERFGLAQLHQLRGRIGRGHKPGTCLLLYGEHLSPSGRQRLETMRTTDDGFKIAEVDLKLRGGGDILGTRQSGMPTFRIADFVSSPDLCTELLALANKEAKWIVKNDPFLQSERGQNLRLLLRLFNRANAIKYTRS
jgi:ATP-dependent DNA helicase RecG